MCFLREMHRSRTTSEERATFPARLPSLRSTFFTWEIRTLRIWNFAQLFCCRRGRCRYGRPDPAGRGSGSVREFNDESLPNSNAEWPHGRARVLAGGDAHRDADSDDRPGRNRAAHSGFDSDQPKGKIGFDVARFCAESAGRNASATTDDTDVC